MRRERFDRINIVPFVDIVLVLLVIVLATATFVQEGRHRIDVPESEHTLGKTAEPIVIAIDANGTYYLGGHAAEWATLQNRLQNMESNTSLLLRADTHAPFGAFHRLIEAIQEQHITRVSIATKSAH